MQGEHPPDLRPLSARVNDLLESRLVRLALASLVIVSLLPLGVVENALRPIFLLAFGAELAARFALWRRGDRSTTAIGIAFAIADAIAFVSFLPLETFFDEETVHLLALLRLTRLLLLVRFARDLARDIYAILTRREQLQTLGLITGAVVVLSFVSAVILSQLAISVDRGGARLPFREQLWWSFRQIESPDNLVQDLAGNPVLSLLSLLLTITGVFLISFVIGVGANVVEQVVRAERRRDLHYHGHTVVVGNVHDGEDLIREFVRMYAKNRQIPSPERLLTWLRYMRPGPRTFPRVALLSRVDAAPDFLVEPIMRWVVYRQGDESDPASLQRVAAAAAKRAVLLAHHELGYETDAVTISTLAALRAQNPACVAYVEVADPESKDLILDVGGKNTVALDVPRFLGMFLCQHLLMPGVEHLYRDLLTADGCEIYTHIFVDEDEQRTLAARPVPWRYEDLLALAVEHGVLLIGVYLGDKPVRLGPRGVVPIDGLVRWINPAADIQDDAVAALGARRGIIPAGTLRGLIGIAEGYLTLRTFAAAVVSGRPAVRVPTEKPSALLALASSVKPPQQAPRRVALIGYSEALPSLLQELSRFVPGVDVALFLSARGDERTPLARRLASLRVAGLLEDDPLPGKAGRVLALERGGRLEVFTHDGPDLARFAAERLRAPVEAAVFLSEPEGGDRDARTAMRVLRFVRLLEEGKVHHGPKLHVLAEFISVDKGTYIQRLLDSRKCGFADESDLKLTLIAKETIKSYFMVHSAFVPGVAEIYDELLEERGQDIVRFRIDAVPEAPPAVTWRALLSVMLPRQALPIAVELVDGRVVLAPPPDRAFALGDVRGVYCIAESAGLAAEQRLTAGTDEQ